MASGEIDFDFFSVNRIRTVKIDVQWGRSLVVDPRTTSQFATALRFMGSRFESPTPQVSSCDRSFTVGYGCLVRIGTSRE